MREEDKEKDNVLGTATTEPVQPTTTAEQSDDLTSEETNSEVEDDIQQKEESDKEKRTAALLAAKEAAERKVEEYWTAQDALAQKRLEQSLGDIHGRRIGTTLGDLGHIFGDMIRARGGAVVTPRDIQKKYDELSAEQQKAYDNYWARIEALRDARKKKDDEDEKGERDYIRQLNIQAQSAAAAADKEAARQQWQEEMEETKHANRMAEIAAQGQNSANVAEINADGRVRASANYGGRGGGGNSQYEIFETDNEEIKIPRSKLKSRIQSAYDYLAEQNNILIDDELGLRDDTKVANVVRQILNSTRISPEQKRILKNILKTGLRNPNSGSNGSGTGTAGKSKPKVKLSEI